MMYTFKMIFSGYSSIIEKTKRAISQEQSRQATVHHNIEPKPPACAIMTCSTEQF